MSIELLLTVIWLGLFASGATVLIRVLPYIAPLVELGKKPFACDKCMSFWLVLFGVTGVPAIGNEVLHYPLSAKLFYLAGPAAYAVSLFMLRVLTEPGPAPNFGVPELVDLTTPDVGGKTYMPPFSDPPPAH